MEKIPHHSVEPLDRGNIFPLSRGCPRDGGTARRKSAGFTLVELIVVITIIGILSTLAFIGYRGLSETARDAVRISHLGMISRSLEESLVKNVRYPTPDNAVAVTWSGSSAWYQGTVGESVATAIRLSSKFSDPSYGVEYAYSVTANGKQYQLASVYEGDAPVALGTVAPFALSSSFSIPFAIPFIISSPFAVPLVSAASPVSAILRGSYNRVLVPVSGGNDVTAFIAVPSIVLSDLSRTDLSLSGSFSTGAFVVDKRRNLPVTYSGTSAKSSGDFYFVPRRLLSVTGSVSSTDMTTIMEQMKLAYSWSTLATSNDVWKAVVEYASGSDTQTAFVNGILKGVAGWAYAISIGTSPTILLTNCAVSSQTVNGHAYALPTFSSGAQTTGTSIVSIPNGTRTFQQVFSCTSGVISTSGSETNTANTCNATFVWNAWARTCDAKLYVDDVFSTYLYTWNGGSQTINNGIDLVGQWGMVWTKARVNGGAGTNSHVLFDTIRGAFLGNLQTNAINNQNNWSSYGGVSAFGSDGYSLIDDASGNYLVNGTRTYVSWTFRKAPKFFDVVTATVSVTLSQYTAASGTGVTYNSGDKSITIAHNLGSTVGAVILKNTSGNGNWQFIHLPATDNSTTANSLILNETRESYPRSYVTNANQNTITLRDAGWINSVTNHTMVIYLFAHDTTTDGIIQAGSFTTDASGNASVNLGWEPQYLMTKSSSTVDDWSMLDQSRGFVASPNSTGNKKLFANTSGAEDANHAIYVNATGFSAVGAFNPSATYIYLAIRRPNKPPTSGAQVYNAIARTGNGVATNVTGVGFAPDLVMATRRSSLVTPVMYDKFRGGVNGLTTRDTAAESTAVQITDFLNDSYIIGTSYPNNTGENFINWVFRRAPGVFDEVAYSGDSGTPITGGVANGHNLSAIPEMIVVKQRTNAATSWSVYHKDLSATETLLLNTTAAKAVRTAPYGQFPLPHSATVFNVSNAEYVNNSGRSYVAYLFATLPNISKVGSYTGSASNVTVDCGFTATPPRFLMVKRTDSTGDWFVWDSARGFDKRLSLNTTAAEVPGDTSITTTTSGFVANTSGVVNGGTSARYIYLCVH